MKEKLVYLYTDFVMAVGMFLFMFACILWNEGHITWTIDVLVLIALMCASAAILNLKLEVDMLKKTKKVIIVGEEQDYQAKNHK